MKSASPISLNSPSALKSYFLASRPKTWIASLSPVCIGAVMAPELDLPRFFLTLLFSLFIQIGTNFANDYYDFLKGADAHRIGPKRATQEGWITPIAMQRAMGITFAAALVIAIPLMIQAGLWSFGLAILCIAFGILYTGGPKPLGYLGCGELLVFPFFGPVATCGTYFLQTGALTLPVFLASTAPGFLSCSILIANNLRDEVTDRAAGKKTLIARWGNSFGKWEYAFSIAMAALVPLLLSFWHPSSIAYTSLVFVLALKNPPSLPRSALILLLYTLLFCSLW